MYDSVLDIEAMTECSPGGLRLRSNRESKSVVEGGGKSVLFIVNWMIELHSETNSSLTSTCRLGEKRVAFCQ